MKQTEIAYLKFVMLLDEVKVLNKIRKGLTRRDCICTANLDDLNKHGLMNFVNRSGQLILYKTAPRDFVKADRSRRSEWSLTGNNLNFSSVYNEDLNYQEYGYGNPNANKFIGNGILNPMYEFRTDGYLFIVNKDWTEVEILIIPEGRNLISSYYQILIEGGYDELIQNFRKDAKPFYNYEGYDL